jgi:hypothetical protein
MDYMYSKMVAKFGKVTRQTLPFEHCGVKYAKIPNGIRVSQDDFCSKLKEAEVSPSRKDNELLTPADLTAFRSVLGGLLWLTATRLDLVADVSTRQAQVTANVGHLRQANKVVQRARNELGQNLGILFRKLRGPLRLMCVHDSSAAGNARSYAQEGVLVFLCSRGFNDSL